MYTMYLAGAKPWEDRYWNKVEIADEFAYSLLNYFLILFTDLIPYEDDQMLLGWVFCGIMSLYILVNIGIILIKGIIELCSNLNKCIRNKIKERAEEHQNQAREIQELEEKER